MFSRKVTKARNRGRVREVRGGEVCVDFGFVLHTGLDDPTTAESERSLQKQQHGRKEPSDFGINSQLGVYSTGYTIYNYFLPSPIYITSKFIHFKLKHVILESK